jgi:hypothetical protein
VNYEKDPYGKAVFFIICVMLLTIMALQFGIAKGRQMERDSIISGQQ